ncbi:MAG: ABC transporter ATP-binding protein/permease [Clostridiales bacterium]|nr:ABC transporter ATP-binding protein/permease [Clostridiales bacterium]
MLTLKNIVKIYEAGPNQVEALRGVDLQFRDCEFAAILGPSGCGKTTLLNIIGGLDQYTDGDLSVNGKTTKQFKDKDWDTYRNHSIGFVFQNYNLIPHQTVLSNVELALTLSGVSRTERRKRAMAVLEKVGLADQMKKKPNQMSGGQMQRVAIARALINDPDILLADEPTGALDSETSVQVMEILKEIAKEKLVIMVTHNPELADTYANRIIRLLDGKVVSDSNPCHEKELAPAVETSKQKKPSMSFRTALSLSLNNLLTKKGRTILTAFAGSIGIIGIALILSLSSGVNAYIERVEEDTLSSYPLTIQEKTMDMSGMMAAMMGTMESAGDHEMDRVYSGNVMTQMLYAMMSEISENNLPAFKAHIEKEEVGMDQLISGIQYEYATPLTVYRILEDDSAMQVNPSTTMEATGMMGMFDSSAMAGSNNVMLATTMTQLNAFEALLDNEELLNLQYDVLAGRMPESMDEVVIIVNKQNEISDYTLYTLGLKDQTEIPHTLEMLMMGQSPEVVSMEFSYEELLGLRFRLMVNTDYFEKQGSIWVDRRNDPEFVRARLEEGMEIRVVGILRPSEEAVATSMTGAVGYRSELMEYLLQQVNESEIVQEQLAQPDTDIFTGMPFSTGEAPSLEEMMAHFDPSLLPPQQQALFAQMSPEQLAAMMHQMPEAQMKAMMAMYMPPVSNATLDENLLRLGVSDINAPSAIHIYPKDFEAKEQITRIIDEYNASVPEEDALRYTDYVGLMMSSVTTIINAITYILIAFVAISLVVSSIMIGIITYISVLERTKEIGILRAIGASKKDISRVFNAETLIVGFSAGALGIGVTLALDVLANTIIRTLTTLPNIAVLPPAAAVILILISMLLTFIAGLIPSRLAAKKDPVVALRSE